MPSANCCNGVRAQYSMQLLFKCFASPKWTKGILKHCTPEHSSCTLLFNPQCRSQPWPYWLVSAIYSMIGQQSLACSQVMTVGSLRPVIFTRSEIARAA